MRRDKNRKEILGKMECVKRRKMKVSSPNIWKFAALISNGICNDSISEFTLKSQLFSKYWILGNLFNSNTSFQYFLVNVESFLAKYLKIGFTYFLTDPIIGQLWDQCRYLFEILTAIWHWCRFKKVSNLPEEMTSHYQPKAKHFHGQVATTK